MVCATHHRAAFSGVPRSLSLFLQHSLDVRAASRPHPSRRRDPMSQLMPADAGTLPAPDTVRTPVRASRIAVTAGFVILALSYMINAMDRQVFFPLLPSINAEYGFSLPAGGFLATGFTLGMAVAGVPAGFLLARRSRKQVLIVSIVVSSLGTLATPLAVGYADMMAYRLVSGLGEGMQSAALFAAVGAYFFHRRALA